MQTDASLPVVPQSKTSQVSLGSIVLLTLWSMAAGAAFTASIFDTWRQWSALFLLATVLCVLALCFSLQWDLVRHYAPRLPSETWVMHSLSGLIGGVVVGAILAVALGMLAIRLAPDVISYETSGSLIPVAAAAGLLVGLATLGARQAQALNPYIRGAWWWAGALAFAWVPVLLVWLGYEAALQAMVINIYPEPHGVVKVLAAGTALLCPALAVFAAIIRRTRAASTASTSQVPQPRQRPVAVFGALLVLPIAVMVAFGGLVVGQRLRVERAWIAEGPADYLSVSPDGRVATTPAADEQWYPGRHLRDTSQDGSMQAEVEGLQVVISTAAGAGRPGATTLTLKVPAGPREDRYAGDVVNVVRFSPDDTLLAAGTGQVTAFDSAISRSKDHAVHVWSLPDGTLRYTLLEPQYSVRALAWSPDGQYLAAGGGLINRPSMFGEMLNGDNVVRVWRLDNRRAEEIAPPALALTLVGHTTRVEALEWGADSRRLVSRDLSGRVVIWNMP